MAKCFSFTSSRDRCFRHSFTNAGLRSTTTDLGDGTVIHCWAPKTQKPNRPNLLLLHGLGANAMWQWNTFLKPLVSRFNVYVPDLVFFGDSYTTRPDRTEKFQAQCMKSALESQGVRKMSVVGISYGSFVAYSLAADVPERVEKLVLCCSGVCLEEADMEKGLFVVKTVDEAASILLPQTPEKVRLLLKFTFYKPVKVAPGCFLQDFIDAFTRAFGGNFWVIDQLHHVQGVMCTENRQERVELIHALLKGRKLSDLPKIMQPTLIIWGEQDQVFPLELGRRLKRHLDGNAQLVVIKKAGHALNVEKPKDVAKHLKAFLVDASPSLKEVSQSNGHEHDVAQTT